MKEPYKIPRSKAPIILVICVLVSACLYIYAPPSDTSPTRAFPVISFLTNTFRNDDYHAFLKEHAHDIEALYQRGRDYQYGNGRPKDNQKAYNLFEIAAKTGHSRAQNKIGAMLNNGDTGETNYYRALQWYERSAANEDKGIRSKHALSNLANVAFFSKKYKRSYKAYSELVASDYTVNNYAQRPENFYRLGWMQETGNGTDRDGAKARHWYEEASKRGHAKASYRLSQLYKMGTGVPKDDIMARTYLEKAAEQGHVDAQIQLARQAPRVSKPDTKSTLDYYKMAALQGDVKALTYMATAYEFGIGTKKDLIEAYAWRYALLKKMKLTPDNQSQAVLSKVGLDSLETMPLDKEEKEAAKNKGDRYYRDIYKK